MNNLYIISGVTGMTGSELVHQILSEGKGRVIGFDNFFCSSIHTVEDCLLNPGFRFFEWDLNSEVQMEQLETLVEQENGSYEELIYINCAAVVHTEYFYRVNDTFDTNVIGMKNFLEQAMRRQADIFINCSTSEVYSMNSWNEEGGVTEESYVLLANAEHSQRTSYAVGKLMTEFFMKDAVLSGKIKGCSIRFANVYSKNELQPKHIIPHIFNELVTEGTVTLLENSRENRRTFLHNIDSCAAVLALAGCKDALDGSVYNVATSEEVTILELVNLCAEAIGIEAPAVEFSGFRNADPKRRLLSAEKIHLRAGWSPQIDLKTGLSMCALYWKEQKQLGDKS